MGTHSRVGRITLKGGATLHLLPKPAVTPDADTIERLEGALESVRAGKWQGCAIILTATSGAIATAYSNSDTGPLVWGAAELTKRLLAR